MEENAIGKELGDGRTTGGGRRVVLDKSRHQNEQLIELESKKVKRGAK